MAPATITANLYSKPEALEGSEDAAAFGQEALRDAAAARRVDELNNVRHKNVPRIGLDCYYHEAKAILKSMLFFSPGKRREKENHRFITKSRS